jgi:hypothetical protein
MNDSKLVDVSKTSVQNFVSFMRKVVNYVFLLLVLAAGFFVGKTYVELKPGEKNHLSVQSVDQVSIAVDESNQILIINRETGEYQIFSDSVGITIFKMYANWIYSTQPQ